jgi:hypothetical protein
MPTFESLAKIALTAEVVSIHSAAERHVMRTQTDFIGRLCACYSEVDAVFDEASEGELSPEQASRAYGAYQEMAALAIAQLAFIRLQHPNVGEHALPVDESGGMEV